VDTVYITGHRNPDMDSLCAATAYARLKSRTDPAAEYRAIRTGPLKKSVRMVFREAGLEPPELMKDVYPRVLDVTRRDMVTLDEEAPVFEAIRQLDEQNLSVIPVFREGHQFRGIISIHEINRFLISENLGERPIYEFRIPNFQKVLPGYFYLRGEALSITAPIMTGAMPYEISLERLKALETNKPVLVIGLRKDLLAYAVESQLPAIIITGLEKDQTLDVDFSGFRGSVYISQADTAETIRLLRLSAPVGTIMNSQPLGVEAEISFDEARDILMGSPYRGMPVFQEGRFAGIVTRRCFIKRPEKQLILVDHNELEQSIPGAEQASVREILDHHRIATGKTREPIYVYARPLGSTCSIVFLHYRMAGVEIPAETALVLLSGLLADTLNLASPTTTDEDRRIAGLLGELAGRDPGLWGDEIFSHSASLKNSTPGEIILEDFKTYREQGIRLGIGQAEVITLEELPEVQEDFLFALGEIAREKQLDWVMLLITNVNTQDSILLTSCFAPGEKHFLYESTAPGVFSLPGVLSRKKQLFPEVCRVLEEMKEGRVRT